MSKVLYEDKGIVVAEDYINIKKYYFPLGTSKIILFKDIETVAMNSSEDITHRWGISRQLLNNWFSLDGDRVNKKKYIEIQMKGKSIKPSFTPDDPQKVINIIWQNCTEDGKKTVEARSSRGDVQTEIAQQQMMERQNEMKEGKDNLEATENDLKMKK